MVPRLSYDSRTGLKDFDHAPEAAMAYQDQSQNKLANPVFRHRQVKQNLILVSRGYKGLIERIRGLCGLLIEEFAADPIVLGQIADRFGPGQYLN